MAHDPRREDYQRLGLRYACELDDASTDSAAHAFSSFGRRFAQDYDNLPQSDADRAFHLVVLATNIIDYQLPFAAPEDTPKLISRGKELLDEAVRLDAHCYDAIRMRSSTNCSTVEARFRFLAGRVDEVQAFCEKARDKGLAAMGEDRGSLIKDLAMRPYWRWLASMAESALICGRNHSAISIAERLLASDPHDSVDIRFTLAYALAKLEDDHGLEDLVLRYRALSPARGANDAWLLIARMALAYKRFDLVGARQLLYELLGLYRTGATALIRQLELADGEFARLRVAPYSEDELILAVSEAIVLFQEGYDRTGRGVFGAWVASEVGELYPEIAEEVARIEQSEGPLQ